jgi:hypothetical protein
LRQHTMMCFWHALRKFIYIFTALWIPLSSHNSIRNTTEVGLTDGRIGFDIIQLVTGSFEPRICGSLATDLEYKKVLFQR